MRHGQNHSTWDKSLLVSVDIDQTNDPTDRNRLLEVSAGPSGDLVGAEDQLLRCAAPQSARDARLRIEGWIGEIKLTETLMGTPFRNLPGKPQ